MVQAFKTRGGPSLFTVVLVPMSVLPLQTRTEHAGELSSLVPHFPSGRGRSKAHSSSFKAQRSYISRRFPFPKYCALLICPRAHVVPVLTAFLSQMVSFTNPLAARQETHRWTVNPDVNTPSPHILYASNSRSRTLIQRQIPLGPGGPVITCR